MCFRMTVINRNHIQSELNRRTTSKKSLPPFRSVTSVIENIRIKYTCTTNGLLSKTGMSLDMGRDRSVGIATGDGLDGPGIESPSFGGLGVSMLASGTQDRGFAPDRSRRIFPTGEIHSMPSFGRGSKIICPMLVTRTTKRSKRSKKVNYGILKKSR
jgi:hypothetical protein